MKFRRQKFRNFFPTCSRKKNRYVIGLLFLILFNIFLLEKKDANISFEEELIQLNEESCLKNSFSREWKILCTNDEAQVFTEAIKRLRLTTSKINIVQIGAHVGFERNDPIAAGIISLIESIPKKYRSRFRWTFVELNHHHQIIVVL